MSNGACSSAAAAALVIGQPSSQQQPPRSFSTGGIGKRMAAVASSSSSRPCRSHGTVATKHPQQVQRRNLRERRRVEQVNMGFVTLRNHVPVGGKNKKLSKVETLRQAAKYINYLQQVLTVGDPSMTPYLQPQPSAQELNCVPSGGFCGSPADCFRSAEPSPVFYSSQPVMESPVDFMSGYYGASQQFASAHSAAANFYAPPQLLQKLSPDTSEPSPSSSFVSDNSYELESSLHPAAYLPIKNEPLRYA